jgi:hypothetical protein
VRILKDLARRLSWSDADFKGFTEKKNAKGLEVRILKKIERVGSEQWLVGSGGYTPRQQCKNMKGKELREEEQGKLLKTKVQE